MSVASDRPGLFVKTIAIIVAAGRGHRAGQGLPKQYRTVAGRPVLAHTLEPFLTHPGIDAVICAIHPDDRDLYDTAVAGLPGRERLLEPAHGGATRQDSVRLALEALGTREALCLVHDAARMFVDTALLDRALAAGRSHPAALPGIAVTDTMKRVAPDGRVAETVERSELRAVQTPQVFAYPALLDAHRRAASAGRHDFTDDGGLAEWAGLAVHIFEGDVANMKVTHPADFDEAERRLGGRTLVSRLATGFDVHIFGEGDHVWLGGVKVPHERGTVAHSDGDVVLHALTDAVLGTLADGDIGTHFPPSDPQWKDASSDRFLAFAVERVREAGGIVDHLDATVLCERPKIGPHREAIRARIAEIAGVPLSSVSIKATTTERLGFTGRGEGIAAQAAASVRLPESR
ncbi:bifunctional 2-C-methyl-D-erythritol 4-phosphate cytidylyltransferase/2-C-methyl-D-erythritol 2,4-cyclodiphosphate synthase [Enterovirga rhinocerotis]|uniref:Bifunctional enzyme IspD/IspF n=1 Tax=Enterovirga rhinocerotis TaxID=1339210 RepID=A0A4R7C7I6_9HYPH|nr:bifunctional 2-C-methyl-D-erythritol 4-phosphate cytidylyltransferase/2-C-methyl-D-erythritol 2,4-cyclodiphosphate synthase [Enterovirga rhinocerotis]TDR94251.1 2-C-methyl-D-erythritol 2,4-cyclodiphosphate synthase [Enterovirga rhinocerotis]